MPLNTYVVNLAQLAAWSGLGATTLATIPTFMTRNAWFWSMKPGRFLIVSGRFACHNVPTLDEMCDIEPFGAQILYHNGQLTDQEVNFALRNGVAFVQFHVVTCFALATTYRPTSIPLPLDVAAMPALLFDAEGDADADA